MCGIFAYFNHCVPRERKYIVNLLIQGLKRLEYRGYDSAGVAIDGDVKLPDGSTSIEVIKKRGKVAALEAEIFAQVRATFFRL